MPGLNDPTEQGEVHYTVKEEAEGKMSREINNEHSTEVKLHKEKMHCRVRGGV